MAEYIEREAVLALKKPFPTSKDSVTLYQQYFISPTAVEKIPAADVAPVRHGRWIKYAPDNSDMMTCSECEKYWILDGDQYDFRYCPNCGARMDGDGE